MLAKVDKENNLNLAMEKQEIIDFILQYKDF